MQKITSNWGAGKTEYFYKLSPDKILLSAESCGLKCTGRVLQLNSMENRVYEVEIEVDESELQSKWDKSRIIKFYRPGRWSKEQILDEHQFLADLAAGDLPVAAAIPFEDGSTLKTVDEVGIDYAVFPKIGGRNPDEMTREKMTSLGRLIARMHLIGGEKAANHRLRLDIDTFGTSNLKFLLDQKLIPLDFESRYKTAFEKIMELTEPHLKMATPLRIHGDLHFGNVLEGSQGTFFVDFDDMLTGPAVQDLWLVAGASTQTETPYEDLLAGYTELRHFPIAELKLAESLRAMRFVHFAAWIGKRIEDPYFAKTFTEYGSWNYWQSETTDLERQLATAQSALTGSPVNQFH